MDDPWSTPWAVDDPSASPGLPPPREEFEDAPGAGGLERSSPWGETTPRQHKGGEDGHGDEDGKDCDGWGGWDDAKQLAWDARIAPLEEPVDGLATPWGTREQEEHDDGDVLDSAAAAAATNLGVRTVGRVERKAIMLLEDEQDAWKAPREQDAVIAEASDEELARAEEAKWAEQVNGVVGEEELGDSTLDWQSQQQQQQHKASKVQELVDMYDGIAKKAVRPAAEPSPLNEGIANEQRESAPVNIAHDTTSGEQPNHQQPHLATMQPHIQNALYPINLSHLDALFPGSNPASDTPPAFVPDTILTSTSFTTTSERKTWYRVSRFGSTRFHDNGDDEAAYRRVAWPSSSIRTKTLDIVRRWMEEDSIAGRVVLGAGRKAGGPLGASMFGWDDGAPQVEIGELLRRRRRQQQRSGHADSKGSSMKAERGEDGVREKTQMMETAGLRSPAEMPRSPWDDDEPPRKQRSSVEAMPPPLRLAEADAWRESISEPAPAQDESAKEGEYGNDDEDDNDDDDNDDDDDDDDDDDWGEMVSSLTVDASTTFASLSASVATTSQKPSSEVTLNGLVFVESLAAKPAPSTRTAGTSGLDSSAAAPSSPSSPTWTPTLNSPPIFEPITTRVSADSVSQAKPAVFHGALTPTLEAPRASTSSNRVSAEHVWAPAASTTTTTKTTEHRLSTEHAWTDTPATDNTNNSAFMETPWRLKVVGPVGATTPPGTSAKDSLDRSMTITDTCIVDEKTIVDEALKSLPDLSYMLH